MGTCQVWVDKDVCGQGKQESCYQGSGARRVKKAPGLDHKVVCHHRWTSPKDIMQEENPGKNYGWHSLESEKNILVSKLLRVISGILKAMGR